MRTILLNLPYDCRGYIVESLATGEACCVLNARMTYEQNQKTYEHELEHLQCDDLHSVLSANVIERERHYG
jgi:hypothetical protein